MLDVAEAPKEPKLCEGDPAIDDFDAGEAEDPDDDDETGELCDTVRGR